MASQETFLKYLVFPLIVGVVLYVLTLLGGWLLAPKTMQKILTYDCQFSKCLTCTSFISERYTEPEWLEYEQMIVVRIRGEKQDTVYATTLELENTGNVPLVDLPVRIMPSEPLEVFGTMHTANADSYEENIREGGTIFIQYDVLDTSGKDKLTIFTNRKFSPTIIVKSDDVRLVEEERSSSSYLLLDILTQPMYLSALVVYVVLGYFYVAWHWGRRRRRRSNESSEKAVSNHSPEERTERGSPKAP